MPKNFTDLGEQDLLKHFPDYGVLVCKSCQFAIQPSALSSHLLRHQIYRSERRQLIERLKELGLREPEKVTYPGPDAKAIAELPVYRGWFCQSPDCGHACASEKRMAQHWSDLHGSREVAARPAWLQTFFRGNKIRYFEVSEPISIPSPLPEDEDEIGPTTISDSLADSVSISGSSVSELGSSRSNMESSQNLAYTSLLTATQLNMLNLQLMHHWSTVTSYTIDRGTEPPNFWTQNITIQAINGNSFLMFGCLSAAAFHLASEHRHTPKFYEFRKVGLEYQGHSMAGFRQALSVNAQPEASIAFNRLLCLTRCAEHHLDPDSTDSAFRPDAEGKIAPLLAIQECILLLRKTTEMWCAVQPDLPDDSGLRLPKEVLIGLESIPLDAVNYFLAPSPTQYPNIPPVLLEQIQSIPSRLSTVLHNTDETNLAAIRHAYTCLLTCFDRSYISKEIWAKWNGVEAWPKMISTEFLALIESCHPCALVLLAAWALLVKRLEAHKWFLKGETRRMFKFLRETLEEELKELVDEISGFTV
ncbi:uncharacterized protein PV09_07876 [Verruconis gallopava]|uniref:C2H2-type domain-containing protein n=1 Tax=Verruconis gallopava TaxID=253628 RepID=A0A0D2ANH7_9PEZI|nr:uncharacterized protein PV09_07876 [Verruconis gallopava]KIW00694.1 hypothetical protein PV09_07876 [Verruconis gallopava]